MADRIRVARIGAAHGVRGEVKLWSFTEDPLAVAQLRPAGNRRRHAAFRDRDAARRPRIIWSRASTASRDRDAAESLRNLDLLRAARAPAADRRGRHVLSRRPDRARGGDAGRRGARHRASRCIISAPATHRDHAGRRRRAAAAAVHRSDRAEDRSQGATQIVVVPPAEIEARGRLSMWRASVLTIFPEMFPGPARRKPRRQGAAFRHLVARRHRHPRRTPPTSTAPSTTRRPAAGPAW